MKEFKYSSVWFKPDAKAQNILRELQFQLKELYSIINPNNSYDFLKLKQEINRLKYQELAHKFVAKKPNLISQW